MDEGRGSNPRSPHNHFIVKAENPYIETDIADMLMERPVSFSVAGRSFRIFWPSLGKTLLVSRLLSESGVFKGRIYTGRAVDAVLLSKNNPGIASRVIAYSSLSSRDEILNPDKVASAQETIQSNLDEKDMSELLTVCLSMYDIEDVMQYYGMDEEQKLRINVMRLKQKNGGNVHFGGRSMYGTVIDALCQRYGWTMEYVVWGISYPNIQMLLTDAQTSVYLTKEERKRIHLPQDIINADDPANMERIKNMFND